MKKVELRKQKLFSKPPVGEFYNRYGTKSFKYTDAIFAWSNFDYKALLKRFPKHKKKFLIQEIPELICGQKN